MSKVLLYLFIMPFLVGCTSTREMLHTMYNIPSSGSSSFDGSKHIRVRNILCSPIVFELYQESRQHKEKVALVKAGTLAVTNIADGEALHLKINDRIYSFTPVSQLTEHDSVFYSHGISTPFSYKTFVVPVSVIREAAESGSFYARLHLLNQNYVDGKCSPLTLAEAQEAASKYQTVTITEENLAVGNEVAGVFGFREFVKMMGTTSW